MHDTSFIGTSVVAMLLSFTLLLCAITDRMGVATRLPPKYDTCGKKTFLRLRGVTQRVMSWCNSFVGFEPC
eukprot:scaffold22777_cov86-Skeletonema_dohrnii-CCMP3373.AAC.3